MNLPDGYVFRCREREKSPGLIISRGILELPDDTDEPATIIEWFPEGLTQVVTVDEFMEFTNAT